MSVYTEYQNVLNTKDYEYCINTTLRSSNWVFSGYSNENLDSYMFWYNDLMEDSFYTNTFLSKINLLTGRDLTINRVYANGQTHGLPGNYHKDDIRNNCYTFLYYVNPVWDFTWGGNTVLINDNKLIQVPPKPNGAILFKSNLWHMGFDPSRHCKELRVTVAFKLIDTNEMED